MSYSFKASIVQAKGGCGKEKNGGKEKGARGEKNLPMN